MATPMRRRRLSQNLSRLYRRLLNKSKIAGVLEMALPPIIFKGSIMKSKLFATGGNGPKGGRRSKPDDDAMDTDVPDTQVPEPDTSPTPAPAAPK